MGLYNGIFPIRAAVSGISASPRLRVLDKPL